MKGLAALTVVVAIAGAAYQVLPALGAGGLLHPARHHSSAAPPTPCHNSEFAGAGITLEGWSCHPTSPPRGTVIYLHGIADNHASSVGVIDRFVSRGFDVIAYDSRAHGESGGDACTYGYLEKRDLQRVLDTVERGPVILIGTSLGAATALQAAALDKRVRAVVAAETFSDLRTVATERAPFFFPALVLDKAFTVAETQGRFRIDAVNPAAAARTITVPVLVIHGTDDRDTPPDHSRRVYAALAGPKRLILVSGAHHNESLRGSVWPEIERWVDHAIE